MTPAATTLPASQRLERLRLDLLPARMTRDEDPPAWPGTPAPRRAAGRPT